MREAEPRPQWPSRRTRTRRRRLALVVTAALLLQAQTAAANPWSSPVALPGCGSIGPPLVAFPSAAPTLRSGTGAILWQGNAGACTSALVLAPLSTDDLARSPRVLHTSSGAPVGLSGSLVSATTGRGRIVVAGDVGTVTEGEAGGAFARPQSLGGGPPLAAASSYLGDVALASVVHTHSGASAAITLRIQRHSSDQLIAPRTIHAVGRRISALAVTLDYRGDVLVAWQARMSIYATVLHASGKLDAVQRVGASGPNAQLQALVSDDGRGIVAWASTRHASTSIYLNISAPALRFGPPLRLETFRPPAGVRLTAGSLRLTRLATESVIMAWTGMSDRHLAVRITPVLLGGPRPPATVSDPHTDAVLADLQPGPDGEVLALWTAGARRARSAQIVAARGFVARGGHAAFRPSETIAIATASADPSVAIDPGNDRALVAWRGSAPDHAVLFSARMPGPGMPYKPRRLARAPAQAPAGHRNWLLAVVAALALAAAAALVYLRRRR